MKLELPKLPELKRPSLRREGGGGSSLQAPAFLADLFYDLRDRRLLPVVALVLVSIAAVPLLLGGDAETSLPPARPSGGASTGPEGGSSLTVVEANPGLRDYRKRLEGRTPADPFASRGATGGGSGGGGSEGSAAASNASAGSGASSSPRPEPPSGGEADAPAKPVAPESPPSSDGGSSDGNGSGGGGSRGGSSDDLDGKRLYGFRPDVRFGVAGSGQLALHDDLPLGSMLPKKNAVVLFVGVTQNGKRALFSVAPEVLVRGDGGCVGGEENCRFLSMREGDAVDLLTDVPGRSYRLKVETLDFVELEMPPKSERASDSGARGSRRGLAPGFPQNFSN